jgi:3-deoxy-manno-octulosonate cytidylyltransferase (CMP-KDO synthetase)
MSSTNKIAAIIPARYASTRFPGKPLIDLLGKSMLQRVYEQVQKVKEINDIYVATDDSRIQNHAQSWNAKVVLTDPNCQSGTERIIQAMQILPSFDYYINVQSDEPLIAPEQIQQLIQLLLSLDKYTATVATLKQKIYAAEDIANVNIVKLVTDNANKALYFSRLPIPYIRNANSNPLLNAPLYYKHIGIYGFTRPALLQIAGLAPHPLEMSEQLEQLRWLANQIPIYTAETHFPTQAIDTPSDVPKVIALLKAPPN